MKSQMENERLYAAKLRAESDQQWAQKLESLKQEMQRMTIEQQKVAAEQLAAKQSDLQENNRLQMDELLKPIKEQFADFKKSVEESKTQNEVDTWLGTIQIILYSALIHTLVVNQSCRRR